MSGMLGKKIGMTRIFDESGNMVPVTVLEAGPCQVVQVKTRKNDGYDAVQIGYGEKKEKKTSKPLAGHFQKSGVSPKRFLKEFPLHGDQEFKAGDTFNVNFFKAGDKIKVSGTSKGRGFAGVIKRHGFGGGPVSHGQSDRLRAPGSLGQSSDPSRVFKGLKMPGRMGNKRASVRGLTVVKVDEERNLIFVKGAVPGSRNNFVEILKIS